MKVKTWFTLCSIVCAVLIGLSGKLAISFGDDHSNSAQAGFEFTKAVSAQSDASETSDDPVLPTDADHAADTGDMADVETDVKEEQEEDNDKDDEDVVYVESDLAKVKPPCQDLLKAFLTRDSKNSNSSSTTKTGPFIYGTSLGMRLDEVVGNLEKLVSKKGDAKKEIKESAIITSSVPECSLAWRESKDKNDNPGFKKVRNPALFSGDSNKIIPHFDYGLCTKKLVEIEKDIRINGLLGNDAAVERQRQISKSVKDDFCLNSLTVRKLKKNKWTSYVKYHFREEYTNQDCQENTDLSKQVSDEGTEKNQCPLIVTKIEWKSDWADHSNWLAFARADILKQFQGDLLGNSAPTPHKWLIDNGPVIRYWWSDNQSKGQFAGTTRQIQNWDEFRHAYCKCKYAKKCSCDNANKTTKPDTFLTLDISYQPTAVLTISRGPVFEEPWERRQKRYIAEQVHAASTAQFKNNEFLSVEGNSRWMHQSPIKNDSQTGASNNKATETR